MPQQKHTVEEVKTDLEIDEDLDLHEKGWKLQRFGWFFIFALVILAALGVFGDGIASKTTLTANGAKIKYDKYYRHEARMELKVDAHTTDSSQMVISFPNEYLKKFRVESILPEPKENKLNGDQVSYYFLGSAGMSIVFYLVPQEIGTIHGSMNVNNSQFPLHHFIYP
ncbi:MAG: hypothetical protein ICV79_29775 [Flavisolibacter sp.]|nr:hypothetical protein [Flavisolibacter sp.]